MNIKKSLTIGYGSWCGLGFFRGINYYKYNHDKCNDDKYKNTGQNVANIQIYKNNKDNLDFIKEYYKFCCLNNYHYVTDEPSYSLNDPMFKEHRHDQSILSLLFKKYGASVFPDHWNDYEYPIIAIRRKY